MRPCISIKCAWPCTFPAEFLKNQGRLRSEINVAVRYVYKAAQYHMIQTGHAKYIFGDQDGSVSCKVCVGGGGGGGGLKDNSTMNKL